MSNAKVRYRRRRRAAAAIPQPQPRTLTAVQRAEVDALIAKLSNIPVDPSSLPSPIMIRSLNAILAMAGLGALAF